jgi:hypothetical protein
MGRFVQWRGGLGLTIEVFYDTSSFIDFIRGLVMRMNKLLKIVCGFGAIVGMVGFFGEPSWGRFAEPWRNLPSHIPPNGEGWIYLGSEPAPGCVYARWVNSQVIEITQRSSSGFVCALRPSYSVFPPRTGDRQLHKALLSSTPEIIVDSSLPSLGAGWVWENRPHSCVFGSWVNHRMTRVSIRRDGFQCESLVASTYRTLSR